MQHDVSVSSFNRKFEIITIIPPVTQAVNDAMLSLCELLDLIISKIVPIIPYITQAVSDGMLFLSIIIPYITQAVSDGMLAELRDCFMEAYDDNQDGRIEIREVGDNIDKY